MSKKLNLLCIVILAVLSTPALASPIRVDNPLKVDIDCYDAPTEKLGWKQWLFEKSWTGPAIKTFDIGGMLWENPVVEFDVYKYQVGAPSIHAGIARNRSGGWAGITGTGEYSPTGLGFGMNYVRFTFSNLDPHTMYDFSIWAMEERKIWACSLDNPDSKYIAWSQTNPMEWLLSYGYDGSIPGEPPYGGYGLTTPGAWGSYMPCGLFKELLAKPPASLIAEDDACHLGENICRSDFKATTDEFGAVTVYGWIDPRDWSGSMHVPVCGFMVIPEPVTIALLGLGGLVLLRERRK